MKQFILKKLIVILAILLVEKLINFTNYKNTSIFQNLPLQI